MIRQRARAFVNFFHNKRRKTNKGSQNNHGDTPDSSTIYLRMETFVSQNHSTINEKFLKSSSSESSDGSENEISDVLSWNKKTGSWETYVFQENETESPPLPSTSTSSRYVKSRIVMGRVHTRNLGITQSVNHY